MFVTKTRIAAAVAGCTIGIAGGLSLLNAQTQPTRPRDPLPSPRQPANPDRTNPNQNPSQNPNQNNPNQNNPNQTNPNQQNPNQQNPNQAQPPVDPNDPNFQQDPNALPYRGPFMFQDPQSETALSQRTQNLLRMEERFAQSRQELLRRLGDARALTGERRLDALTDVIQQMLMDQEQMHQYLIAARSAWTGDINTNDQGANDDNRFRRPPERTTPNGTPANPNNPNRSTPNPNTTPRSPR